MNWFKGRRPEAKSVTTDRIWLAGILFAATLIVFDARLSAQSLISGDIVGTITDASGAAVPDASVKLKSLDTGASQSAATNNEGSFRFALVKPGRFTVTASAAGFDTVARSVDVTVGQVATANLRLEIGKSTQTVEITDQVPLVTTDPSNNTAFTQQQLAQLPSAGGDITNIAFTAPGVVVNSTGGYGNFTVNGLPATSNLFTVNGENNMDPYFNVNNSGATNLSLGQNELQEATVISNAYSGQYGQLSGAQVSYVTMSGTNQFHGNALYWWNGRTMNANNWFNNATDTTRPFSNANQWAARIGGPIIRDKTFFFMDTEGLRFVLPVQQTVTIPTTAFANAVLANVQKLQPVEASTYGQMFKLWADAPGSGNALPMPNSAQCNSLALPGFDPSTQACATRFQATPSALASEWILTARVDQKLSEKDNAFFRYKLDHGTQPTTVSPISPAFDAISSQPSWDTQFNETHVFGASATNQFMATFSHYVAQFAQDTAAADAALPYTIINSSPMPFTGLNSAVSYPQGRNITQYQFIDDYNLTHGKHSFKFGANFRRYDVSDHNFTFNSPGVYFGYVGSGLQKFSDGVAYQYRMSDNFASDVPIAMLGFGLYGQDEWSVTPHLRLTLALRAEHSANPSCNFNCFANFNAPWTQLASVTNADPGSVPYSSDIAYNQRHAFQSVDAVNWSPRIGFSWSPGSDNKTVVSGGVGIFYDSIPAGLVDDLLANPPVSVAIRVRPAAGTLPFDPNGGPATWAASAAAFDITKTYNQISSELQQLGAVFAPPAFTALAGKFHSQQFQEWNFQVQQALTNSLAVTVNYTGNHGIHIPYSNAWPNAYDPYGLYPGVQGISETPAVPNYGTVTTVQSGALSNYNAMNLFLTKRFSHWVSGRVTYTLAHGLDEVSNGGVFTYGDSTLGQINPVSLRANNYGNSDYDIRNNFTGDFVVNPTVHFENKVTKALLNNWQIAGKIFWRSGLPFSITDANATGLIFNGGGSILAQPISGNAQTSCGAAANYVNGVPCLNASAFLDSATINNFTQWSPQNRNQYRGPGYFDMDMSLYRNFALTERVMLGIGVQAFNAFNHPNFGAPDYGLGNSTFGLISSMTGTPTSAYGNFLGFDSSPRAVQLSGKIVF